MAILLHEAMGPRCLAAMKAQGFVCISAGTLTEALIVAGGRDLGPEMAVLIEELVDEVAPVDGVAARRAAEAHARWGKGVHPARLNLGDCFAYALADLRGLPILYVGNDFSQTDIRAALP